MVVAAGAAAVGGAGRATGAGGGGGEGGGGAGGGAGGKVWFGEEELGRMELDEGVEDEDEEGGVDDEGGEVGMNSLASQPVEDSPRPRTSST